MTQYTSAYIDGINEGRNLLQHFHGMTLFEFETHKKNAQILMRGASFAMKDYYKGQRDFWDNQIKKTKGQ